MLSVSYISVTSYKKYILTLIASLEKLLKYKKGIACVKTKNCKKLNTSSFNQAFQETQY